ncbi:porin family protein [Lutibacter sp. TH_r2]|uniref:porin family protein n=1 Tax=Lutibacter sp. TH_r2 TaxID=3082083 RepID=UPI0029529EF9|nr:porin family protein [Lutibacter sp. TH_r2]MDV7186169.1 porin family protein [Lutibacter sp. TH_r2]
MKQLVLFIVLIFTINVSAQIENDTIDSKYLEDQLYISLTYNLLTSKPSDISQNGFSGGFSMGFVKDIPLNKERNFGIGIGFGYAYNAYIQNLKIREQNSVFNFDIAEDFDVNRLSIHAIDLPFEIRFRNSTPTKYKFWRIYAGVKFSYLFSSKYKYNDSSETLVFKNISSVNKFQYGLTLSAGYEVWNLYIYYGLEPLFKDAFLEAENIKMKDIHIGLKLYIM